MPLELPTPRLVRILREMANLPVAPFHEGAVIAYLIRSCEAAGIETALDRWGNLVARLRRGRAAPVTLLAHMDHPGLVITESRARTARARWYGGVQRRYFRGARVRVALGKREYVGVITGTEANEEKRVCWVRLRTEEPVPVGAFGSWDLPCFRRRGPLLEVRGADDTLGCAGVLAAVLHLAEEHRPADLWAVFTRAEEDGLHGATGLGLDRGLPMQAPVVVVECSREMPAARQGLGPVVRVGDRVSVFDAELTAELGDTAAELARGEAPFRWQRALMDGGVCEASALARFGYRTGGLAIPLGNYHNMGEHGIAAESIRLDDFRGLCMFLAAFASRPPDQKRKDAFEERLRTRFRIGGPRLLATVPGRLPSGPRTGPPKDR